MKVYVVLSHAGYGEDKRADFAFMSREDAEAYIKRSTPLEDRDGCPMTIEHRYLDIDTVELMPLLKPSVSEWV